MSLDRAESLAAFRHCALQILRSRPQIRSVMLAVAQYSEHEENEMHARIIGSLRDAPLWPHVCLHDWPEAAADDDHCNFCGLFYQVQDVRSVSLDALAFERFCHAHGDAARDHENYLPYAIARRDGDEIAMEIVGVLVRPEQDMIPDEPDLERPWLEVPRAAGLYELVCANLTDDEPRRVLADCLLEHEHPRGELIALALAAELAAPARARRDELLAQYGRQWISPLGAVIPASGAHWERGFLARADVFADGDVETVRGAPAWGTVETIRFLGGTDVIDPAMVALRDVGPVGAGLCTIAAAPRPWAIERLHAAIDEEAWVDALWSATTLPRLTHLVLEGAALPSAFSYARPVPAWWSQLERLSIWLRPGQRMPHVAVRLEIIPWVAINRRSELNGEPGWESAVHHDQDRRGEAGEVEITLAGWHEDATLAELEQLVAAQPRARTVALAPSPYWTPLAEDAERISAATGRPVRIRATRSTRAGS